MRLSYELRNPLTPKENTFIGVSCSTHTDAPAWHEQCDCTLFNLCGLGWRGYFSYLVTATFDIAAHNLSQKHTQ